MRLYAALDISWPNRPDDDHLDRLLAEIDADSPVAIEELGNGLRVFFATPADRTRAAARTIAFDSMADCQPCEISDDDWAARSQSQITAIRVGSLTVAPPWDVPADRTGVIVVNPGMGFGTGHHQSTRLCLALLQDQPVAGARVLDVGTGSGVLALGAATLGAERVLAVDVDEDALLCARENAALNAVGSIVTLETLDLEASEAARDPARFDIVLANLTGGLLARHADRLARWLEPKGTLIVSGLTADEESHVVTAFTRAGLSAGERGAEGEWVGLIFTSPSASTTN